MKSVHSKRQEQMKWEEQNLRQPSFDAGMPFYPSGAGADRRRSSPYPAHQEISSPFDEL